MKRERIYDNNSRGILKTEYITIPDRPIEGEVTDVGQIRKGDFYKLVAASGSGFSKIVKVLKAPYIDEDAPQLGMFVKLKLSRAGGIKKGIKTGYNPQVLTWPVYMLGVDQHLDLMPRNQTSLCLIDLKAQKST